MDHTEALSDDALASILRRLRPCDIAASAASMLEFSLTTHDNTRDEVDFSDRTKEDDEDRGFCVAFNLLFFRFCFLLFRAARGMPS
jgi:hypothetical protein